MVPAGIYEMREIDNQEAFRRVHEDRVVFEEERQNYIEQLEKAIPLGSGCYIKCFPVCFSFRGNSGVLLSMGKAASILGRYFNDDSLNEIAREQIYWTLGKTPSGNRWCMARATVMASSIRRCLAQHPAG